MSRRILFLLFAGLALLTLGARCVENTHVFVDEEGYTHITGEMYNDTDIQGAAMLLRGTLYDGAGNVIAEKDSAICPPDLQPRSQVLFDIRFDNPGIPPHASYSVRAIGGRALPAPLPDPEVLVLGTDAVRFVGFPQIPGFPISDSDVFFRFDVRNRSAQAYTGIQGCSAAYNNEGKIIATDSSEIIQFNEDGFPETATLENDFPARVFMHVENVPQTAAYVRAWLWFGEADAGTSAFQYIMTQPITIQTDQFP
jgi:hypothetical protein